MSKRIYIIVAAMIIAGVAIYFRPARKTSELTGDKQREELRVEHKFSDVSHWSSEIQKRPGRESLDSLRGYLLSLSDAEAVAKIENFLQSGEDNSTGIAFEIGSGGALKGSPTLRVYLLDLLLEIDPVAAARISREILAKATTADEWAVSLRNVARGELGADNKEYLRTKAEELITNAGWQADPSVGYLNAFDVLVHTEATESTALLSDLIQGKERRDLAHAGFLTLDRLVQRKPVEMLTKLQVDRDLLESRPEMVAQEFARADLRDAAQRQVVKAWLLSPERTPTELSNFAGIYPNNNKMISQNLLTSEEPVAGSGLREHDLEVLSLIRSWREDPTFDTLAPYLEIMDRRLSEFTKGAENPPR